MNKRSIALAGLLLTLAAAAQTPRKIDIDPTGSSSPEFITPFGDSVLFVANSNELWISDGVSPAGSAGTRRIDGNPGGPFSVVGHIEVLHGLAYFTASEGQNGSELWVTDGTDAGTHLFADLRPGLASSLPQHLRRIGHEIWFSADAGAGLEPWVTDGTLLGTRQVADINPGPASSFPSEFAGYPGRVVFQADNGVHGLELWGTDGTAANTNLLIFRPNGPQSFPTGMTAVRTDRGQELVVLAATEVIGTRTLWITDFTRAGTQPLAVPGFLSPNPSNFARSGEGAYFVANTTGGTAVYYTDGTISGTRHVFSTRSAKHVTPVGSRRLYLSAFTSNGVEPMIYDVSNGNAIELEINPNGNSNPSNGGSVMGPRPFAVAGSKVFFSAAVLPGGGTTYDIELWTIDNGGTARDVSWGCGDAWTDATDPVLGSMMYLRMGVHGLAAPATLVPVMGAPSAGLPFAIPPFLGCRYDMHPTIWIPLPPRPSSPFAGGQYGSHGFLVPLSSGLIGKTTLCQTLAFVRSQARLEIGNPVRLRFGQHFGP